MFLLFLVSQRSAMLNMKYNDDLLRCSPINLDLNYNQGLYTKVYIHSIYIFFYTFLYIFYLHFIHTDNFYFIYIYSLRARARARVCV